jgi:hypothetical protein
MAFGRTWLSAMSGRLADRTDWTTFFIISTFVALPGLIMLLGMMKRLAYFKTDWKRKASRIKSLANLIKIWKLKD